MAYRLALIDDETGETRHIDLSTPLSLRTAFAFPLQTAIARHEVLLGAALLLVPLFGWLLNMGHRIQLVHNMQHGRLPWPAWRNYGHLMKRGTIAFLGMVEYLLPAVVLGVLAWRWHSTPAAIAAAALGVAGIMAIPGYMTHYCRHHDPGEVFNPFRAVRRVIQGGRAYWHAWGIALAALVVSLVGIVGLGLGFLITSVWFWQVAGYAFATVFATEVDLAEGVADRIP